jgi:hypothetical protein
LTANHPLGGFSRGLVSALVTGLVLGVATQIGQSVLPEGFGQVANSISPWLTVAFLVGATVNRPRTAALAGFLTLAMALVGYYALVYIRFGYTGGSTSLTLWTIGAIAGGLVFGPAGWYWRRGSLTAHSVAVGLLGAAFVCEGVYLVRILPNPVVGAAYIAVGVGMPLIATRRPGARLRAWLAMVPAVGLGGLGFLALLLLGEALVHL